MNRTCLINEDCQSGACVANKCVTPSPVAAPINAPQSAGEPVEVPINEPQIEVPVVDLPGETPEEQNVVASASTVVLNVVTLIVAVMHL